MKRRNVMIVKYIAIVFILTAAAYARFELRR